jgi:hypothetical protein
MKINGTNIAEIPGMLSSITSLVTSLIEVTDVYKMQPDIRAGSELTEMVGVLGVFFAHQKGNVEGIYAGGTDISEIVSQGTWNACEEQAEQIYISENAERRTAAAQNNADCKAGK